MLPALVVTALNVVATMAMPWVGFATTAITVLWVLTRHRWPMLQRLVIAAVLTMPLYMVPIIPGLHSIASWTTVFLIVMTFHAATKMRGLSPVAFIALVFIIPLTLLTNLAGPDPAGGWYYSVQVLLMVVPLVLVFGARAELADQIDAAGRQRLLHVLSGTVCAMGVGVIAQWGLYTYAGTIIGSISVFANRVTFDLTISAYSVLSGLLGVGFVLALSLFRGGKPFIASLLIAVTGIAIVLNSSRTGLAAGLAVFLLALMFPGRGVRAGRIRLLIVPGALFAAWVIEQYLESSRGQSMGNVLDDNGRFDLLGEAFALLFADLPTALLGVGYAGDLEVMAPHNFAVETMLRSGLVASFWILVLLLGLLGHLWGAQWQYPVWALLLASMFFTGMYAVKAAPVIVMVMVLLQASELRHRPEVMVTASPAQKRPAGRHSSSPHP